MYFRFILIFCFGVLVNHAFAQLSKGGFPLQVSTLKSSKKQIVRMPPLKQSVIDAAIAQNSSEEFKLKPFKFAHVFEVDLNASNSGQWYATSAKTNVWKLSIESANAKSINLIF